MSRDILNYALTASVLVLTFFLAWILIYIVKIFREIERVVRDVTKAIEKFNSVLDFAKDKISNAAAAIPIIIKGGEKIAEIIANIREKRSRRASEKAEEEESLQNKNKKKRG